MAGQDYVPDFFPGHQVSCIAGANITQGQVVYVSANTWPNPTVSPTSAATEALCGVAAATAASGAVVNVYFTGIHQVAASGSITAGGPVAAAASGAVAAAADPTANTSTGVISGYGVVIGNALTTAASSLVHIRLNQ
jgi:hypothetical protein